MSHTRDEYTGALKRGWEASNPQIKLIIATPTYDGAVKHTVAVLNAKAPGVLISYRTYHSSLLAMNRNSAWVDAINEKADLLLFLDADVEPIGENWLQTLILEMVKHSAQVFGVVIPAKVEEDDEVPVAYSIDQWTVERVSKENLPTNGSWTAPGLLVTTGCLLIDMRGDWVKNICWTINDYITFNGEGEMTVEVEPEDYNFCRQCHAAGIKVWATTTVKVIHWDGSTAYML